MLRVGRPRTGIPTGIIPRKSSVPGPETAILALHLLKCSIASSCCLFDSNPLLKCGSSRKRGRRTATGNLPTTWITFNSRAALFSAVERSSDD